MSFYWNVHPSYAWWLNNNFWTYQGSMFTCYYMFDLWIGVMIPQPKIDECNGHLLFSILV